MNIKLVIPPHPLLQSLLEPRSGFIPGILRKVAKKYQALFIQNALFKGKLQNLTVYAVPFLDSSDSDDPGESSRHTDGEYCMEFENGRIKSTVRLSVNVEDSPKYIAFIFAHELSHMLLDTQMDYARICDYSRSGCKPGFSCVTRMTPPEPKAFGEGMEESIADCLAQYVVSRCRFCDEVETYAKMISQWHHRQSFAPMLAAAFGDPLEKCRYIDEFSLIRIPSDPSASCAAEEETEDEPLELAYPSIRNEFWYGIAINQFHMVVDAYNEIMGEDAWRELCRHMDAVQQDISYKGTVSEKSLEHKQKAETLIAEFVRRYTAYKENDT